MLAHDVPGVPAARMTPALMFSQRPAATFFSSLVVITNRRREAMGRGAWAHPLSFVPDKEGGNQGGELILDLAVGYGFTLRIGKFTPSRPIK
jgi:hypothetical protein